jgi:hypothetical protein
METNINNEAGRCICSFSFGLDRIYVFEVPDENRGYYVGWLFLFNATPYFYSIAGGSEGLNTYIANTYAQYLVDCKLFDDLEKIMGEDDLYVLGDDTSIAFNEAFDDAMMDAGFVREESGRWVYKRKKKRA